MVKRFIYLAGPIVGCTYKQATNWREAVGDGFLPGIVGISPMRMKEWCQRVRKIRSVDQYKKLADEAEFLITGESHAMCARDRTDVQSCAMVLAYLP